MKKLLLLTLLTYACNANTIDDYQKDCAHGKLQQCHDLGIIYKKAITVRRDIHKAAKYFSDACDKDHASSCYEISLIYKNGEGVYTDKKKAKTLMKKSCDLGFSNACILSVTMGL